jgi:phenylpropionate dioxygenase-like ring-hydroxylating dioxygenase large terminal subunit
MATPSRPDKDRSAYGWPQASPDLLLTGVRRGTPCGEYLRRYWHPVAESTNVTSRPQMVKVLGEDLVLFRDKAGRPGLLYPRCMHRGTSLFYGKVDDQGIRCCYHGWKFDVQGNCLEQPCEPGGGLNRAAARQPWYPVEERYGLVFAYMGPPDRKPVLPRYDALENPSEGEALVVDSTSFGATQDLRSDPVVPYHWLQHWENLMDPYHVYVLHSTFSGTQFAPDFKSMSNVRFEATSNGVLYHTQLSVGGRALLRTNTALLPNIGSIPNQRRLGHERGSMMGWHVPVDDTAFRWFIVARTRDPNRFAPQKLHNGKSWNELTPEERQDYPGDYEAQSSQGAVTLHSEEHLATSDRGIVMMRRLMREQIQVVAEGGDPAGLIFDAKDELIRVPSGNFFVDETGAEPASRLS